MAEIALHATSKERRHFEDLADLYAIVKATEHLEKAYARDAIDADEYTKACMKLLSQFKSTESALTGVDVEAFIRTYSLDAPRAVDRLIRAGVPATTLHKQSDTAGSNSAVRVAETVQFFITVMDAVKLEQKAVDEIHPLMSDLMDSLTRVQGLPASFEPSELVEKWLKKLNSMRAVDELSDDDCRDLSFDLEKGYSGFHRFLKAQEK
ncbi:hypothetical protein TrVE_jg10531 [Triparma verrucosa]|uniref:Vacuolar protein sorting-associated protein 28 homolog n=2 Tax=Triparma TaxID=722752 RepID=A0A9W7F2P8_9STRA|nr:hypothetical protein TrST_g11541 [Triparma strigata]GMI14560.1 hypothetical protein TrVE_jg10531 [Triparma verrucosa]|mmetsp:Transcript_28283/g.53536  ORF Transcript_28283/g.53536 Transcript_28283/m.53536 type:complete len:208 (-) Transcript_28283:6-629(-)|eukprot:CAMPEP_0182490266 /NCGR_PEP_ID=MMETSP1321-20130603/191_1 /TAXON_ID=91990 /ORGANISM="Bolidomonas sp., Strain RCC1657" /LENGTH=207 /DNA_ID=CAMNT_0024692421 /DNA_START=190 /DNA_END=813 /DNA_ORIENTATION=+